jgi:hypothetical protein
MIASSSVRLSFRFRGSPEGNYSVEALSTCRKYLGMKFQ